MRPTYFRRRTLRVSLPTVRRTPEIITALVCCALLVPAYQAEAQSEPRSSIVRPSQGQAVSSGYQRPQQESSSSRSSLPPEAWTGHNASLPPVPGARQPAVTPASYSAPTESVNGAASGAEPAAATAKPKGRVALTPRSKSSDSPDPSTGSSGTLQMLLSVGSSLLIVIGLFLGIAWFYRKTINSPMGGLPKQVVSVLGRTPIAPRQQLLLVRFGSKLVLVSLVQGEVRPVSEITDPLEVDQLAGLCESSQPGSISQSFRSILNQGGSAA